MPRKLLTEEDIRDIRESADGIVKTAAAYGIGPLRIQAIREAASQEAAVVIESRAKGLESGTLGDSMDGLLEPPMDNKTVKVSGKPGSPSGAKPNGAKPAKDPVIPRTHLVTLDVDGYEETTKLVAQFLARPFNATLAMQLSYQYGLQTGFDGTFGEWLDMCCWAFWEHRGYDIFPNPQPILSAAAAEKAKGEEKPDQEQSQSDEERLAALGLAKP